MEVPGLEVESQLQLQAYATATTPDPSCICDLPCSLWQCWILTKWASPGIKPASSQRQHWVLKPLSHNGNSLYIFLSCFVDFRFFEKTKLFASSLAQKKVSSNAVVNKFHFKKWIKKYWNYWINNPKGYLWCLKFTGLKQLGEFWVIYLPAFRPL